MLRSEMIHFRGSIIETAIRRDQGPVVVVENWHASLNEGDIGNWGRAGGERWVKPKPEDIETSGTDCQAMVPDRREDGDDSLLPPLLDDVGGVESLDEGAADSAEDEFEGLSSSDDDSLILASSISSGSSASSSAFLSFVLSFVAGSRFGIHPSRLMNGWRPLYESRDGRRKGAAVPTIHGRRRPRADFKG
ncbi:hypothetical protein BDZ89DRAFT_1120095 [Hymenopellis radicata]|nr:hypothetical protein BDZ89DRAFT_1120095 [Hymenopellis radicata]